MTLSPVESGSFCGVGHGVADMPPILPPRLVLTIPRSSSMTLVDEGAREHTRADLRDSHL